MTDSEPITRELKRHSDLTLELLQVLRDMRDTLELVRIELCHLRTNREQDARIAALEHEHRRHGQ